MIDIFIFIKIYKNYIRIVVSYIILVSLQEILSTLRFYRTAIYSFDALSSPGKSKKLSNFKEYTIG